MSEANVGKVENSSSIKDKNGRLPLGEDVVQRIWKDYFEGFYNIYTYPRTGYSSNLWL